VLINRDISGRPSYMWAGQKGGTKNNRKARYFLL